MNTGQRPASRLRLPGAEVTPAMPAPMTGPQPWRGIIAEYADSLPVPADVPVVTLGEGGTPLLPAPVLSELTGCTVYLKVEGVNPTGSFKDRGMTVAVTLAAARGAHTVICASTGNTSASAAAYAARAGLACAVLVPKGSVALGKLAQALAHGARLLQVDGNFDDCLELVRKIAADYPVALVNSVNPERLQGQKTASFEIVDALGDAPDVHCLPVGNAGNISAYWLGYKEYRACGKATKTPRMLGFQAAGAAPIVSGHPVLEPGHGRDGDPDRQPGVLGPRRRSESGIGRADRRCQRRGNHRRLPAAGTARGRLRRARVGCRRRRTAAGQGCGAGRTRFGGGMHDHRARAEGSRHRGGRRASTGDHRHRPGRRGGRAESAMTVPTMTVPTMTGR